MIRGFKDDKRRVIPAWRDFKTTMSLGELGSEKKVPKKQSENNFLENATSEWEKNKELPYAAELVSAAITANEYSTAKDAAKYIINKSSGLSQILISMANQVLANENIAPCELIGHSVVKDDKKQYFINIHYLKHFLSENPLNSIAWVDLARNYLILGNKEKAYDAIRIALQLSPENRFVLRSVARFFIHIGDLQKAHDILRKSALVKIDPWILASEISIASVLDRTSYHIKIAREVTHSDNFSPFDISELSSALGTLEFSAGDTKSAKKLLLLSLEDPNDNALAQVIWISKWLHHQQIETSIDQLNTVPCAYGANAVASFLNKEWDEALKESEQWAFDQPFSSRPALFASFIAATCLEDYEKSESILKNTIISSPNDNVVINNLAFALINEGKLKEAEKVFNQFKHPNGMNEQIVWNATNGLLSFRKGLIEEGRELYKKAISIASKKGFEDHKALAALYLAREEIKSSTSEANQAFAFAENQAKKSNDVVISFLYDKIKEMFDRSKEKRSEV